MADDELFGADGTQPLPPPPLLPDPLSGLVTGSMFSDTIIPVIAADESAAALAITRTEQTRRRATQPVTRRTTAVAPGATTPTAIPVAASLPTRARQTARPTVTRTSTPIAVPPATGRNTPARNTSARTVSSGTPSARTPAGARPAPGIRAPGRRSAGAGCAMFLVIVIVLITVFVVLGVVLGHGNTGFTGG